MGGAGTLSVSFVLPQMGKLMDSNTTGSELLLLYAYIPAILIVAFLILHIYVKTKKDGKKIRLGFIGGGHNSLWYTTKYQRTYDRYEIVGGVFNSKYEDSLESAQLVLVKIEYIKYR